MGTRTHDETILGTTLNRSYQNFLHGRMMTEMNVTVGDSEVLRNSSSPCMHIPLLYRSSRDRISSASAAIDNFAFSISGFTYNNKQKKKRKKKADYHLCSNRTLPSLSATVTFRRVVYADRITTRPGLKERGRKEREKNSSSRTADEYGISTRTSFLDTDVPGQVSPTGRVE
ncbi:hypothetical protein G5I_12525 [Acromyrmex echinatior]|uniref:Uncharacterized protein n=1 Tax=Acromyrmex echinatior TaxID=103372 RepID=F4X2J5_ACREC|nr:hypothetical protein G5I_12525 [Acromyrmex echinatior]